MVKKRNEAGADAAALECNRICETEYLVLGEIVEVHRAPFYYVEFQEFIVKLSDSLSFLILVLDGSQQVAKGDDLPAQLQFGRDAPGVSPSPRPGRNYHEK
jgi:hypothetical protein